ncbi:hypothetical protein TorRG33x02_043970, partial [Trema orientale]
SPSLLSFSPNVVTVPRPRLSIDINLGHELWPSSSQVADEATPVVIAARQWLMCLEKTRPFTAVSGVFLDQRRRRPPKRPRTPLDVGPD